MKFPKLHHERILEIINSHGYELQEFFLVKRKGWIRIENPQTGQFFTYFKKKETTINPDNGEWEFNFYFKVKINGTNKRIEPTFDSMMVLFDNWVKELN